MFLLTDPKISFILLNPENKSVSELQNNWNYERLCSVLYSKDYTVIPIKELYQNQYSRSFLGISGCSNNDEFRLEVLSILEFLDIEESIIKYLDTSDPVKIEKSGKETPLKFSVYESDDNSKTYIHEGVSFCFKESQRYFIPKKKTDLKEGMVVEFFNNNKWNKKQIIKLDDEFDKMYNLLIKYEKLRIPSN